MKVLYLKEAKSVRPDWMGYAVMNAFSQRDDILNVATMPVQGILKNVSTIKSLVRQYEPDIVVAQGMLASILLFEFPKTLKRIIIDPCLVFPDSPDWVKVPIRIKYDDTLINKWLVRASTELVDNPDNTCIENTFCIIRNFVNNYEKYERLVLKYHDTKHLFLGGETGKDLEENIRVFHRVLNRARHFFDPGFDFITANELLKSK